MSDAELPKNTDIGFTVSPGTSYPSTFSTPIDLVNPDAMLSGTLRGTQFVGSNTLQIDSTQNLITIKNSSAALNQTGVLRVGTVSQNYLGMAVNNGTIDTMFAGQDSSGATVVKIAKPGFDAKTATNDQLIFNSSQNIFKIALSGTAVVPSIPSPGNSAFVTVTHNLGYVPLVFGYVDFGGSDVQPLPATGYNYTTGVLLVQYDIENLTSTTFQIWGYLTGAASGSQAARNVKYYVLQETAN